MKQTRNSKFGAHILVKQKVTAKSKHSVFLQCKYFEHIEIKSVMSLNGSLAHEVQ